MTKYIAAGLGLKAFSCCTPTRRLYRAVGNRCGARQRASEPIRELYIERVAEMLQLARSHGLVADGARVLELGTGWVHWEGITISLFFDVESVLFDVWDNRQLLAMKNYLRQLRQRIGEFESLVSSDRLARACERIDAALSVRSFEELYRRFRSRYVVDKSGTLATFPTDSFDLVVSRGVLEHVDRASALPVIRDTYRILKPQGWALHSINIADHLAEYDAGVHPKLYLSFPEWLWATVGNNDVQYINRLQKGEWTGLFHSVGFETVDEVGAKVSLDGLRIARRWQEMSEEDLQHTFLRLVLRKGAPAAN